MSKVHILPPEIVSKIAAGEVIDRPASVVKELVENALDAQAGRIDITLTDAGKRRIFVKDDGTGIEKDDLPHVFERHATSKIESADDLFSIMSLGFRGEALYSVAAVSDVSLKSKVAGEDSGWEISVRGGKPSEARPCAMSGHGTEIEVNELFLNTPARKKFLKSNSAEINQVLSLIIPYVLFHNTVAFRLTHQNRCLIDARATDNLAERIVDVLNLEKKFIVENYQKISDDGSSAHLFLGDINIKRPRRDLQYVYINGRPVFNKSISYHINNIYRLIMPDKEFPFFLISLNLPAENIDVNIHPTKREIKIKNEQQVCTVLRRLCEQTLMSQGKIKEAAAGQPEISDEGKTAYTPARQSFASFENLEIAEPGRSSKTSSDDYAYPQQQSTPFIPPKDFFEQNKDSIQRRLEDARYIGQFRDKFLLFESGGSLLVVDQHAAQERIVFEQLIRQMQKGQLEIQSLLSPVLVKLTPQEMLTFEESVEEMEKVGLSVTQFDEETVAVHAHPSLLKDVEKAVRQLLAGESLARNDFETIARRACRSSIMAGDKLSREEAEFQREQLLQCLDPFTCPHGRPTVIEMDEAFLDKQFLRT